MAEKKIIRIVDNGKPRVNWYDPRFQGVMLTFTAGEQYEVDARVAAHAVHGGWGEIVEQAS